MKYTKPQDVLDAWNDHCYFTDGMKMAEFIDSLPAEFEIVQPGMVQVKWPEGCTRAALESDAKYIDYRLDTESSTKVEVHLKALAAIAPEEKRKRKAYLWEYKPTHARVWTETEWAPTDSNHWCKVGECEVDT